MNGTASFTTSNLGPGSHNISVFYPGDARYRFQDLGRVTHVVSPYATTVSVSSSPNPSVAGEPVTLTARVAGGSTTPTGRVSFGDGEVLGDANLDANGVATFTTSTLQVGTNTIAAGYQGDATHATSVGGSFHETLRAPTATVIAASPSPSVVGEEATFTATVTGGSSTPTGTMTFILSGDGPVVLGRTPLDASGVATFSTSSLPVGAHTVAASYEQDATHAGSVGTLDHEVVRAPTATGVTAPPNPSTPFENVTFTATVRGGPSTPTGTVAFSIGETLLGSSPLDETGVAVLTTGPQAVGLHIITATYPGDGTHDPSSGSVAHEVVKMPTSTTLAASTAGPVVGQPVTFTATVSPPSATGAVQFVDDGAVVEGCDAQPVSSGQATCTISWDSVGSHHVEARYPGDGAHVDSSSDAVGVTVSRAPTALDAARPVYGLLEVSVSAILTNAATGAPVEGQRVSFRAGSTVLCGATTDATGRATCRAGLTGWLAVIIRGTYTATFSGSTDYLPSSDRA